MAEIIGIARVCFKGKDGNEVNGYNVFYTEPLKGESDEGFRSDRCYFPLEDMSPSLYDYLRSGVELKPVYNRYGKVQSFEPVIERSIL